MLFNYYQQNTINKIFFPRWNFDFRRHLIVLLECRKNFTLTINCFGIRFDNITETRRYDTHLMKHIKLIYFLNLRYFYVNLLDANLEGYSWNFFFRFNFSILFLFLLLCFFVLVLNSFKLWLLTGTAAKYSIFIHLNAIKY